MYGVVQNYMSWRGLNSMKITEAQKAKRLKRLLNYQKKCSHLEVEQNKDDLFQK